MPHFSCVLSFDGKDDFVSLPEMTADYSQGFTVEAWVRWNSYANWSRVIDFGSGAPADNIILANRQTTRRLGLYLYKGTAQTRLESDMLESGVWLHVAATVDAGGTATLYENGQAVATGPVTLPASIRRTRNYIGKSNWGQDGHFHGQMAELRLWNVARTEAEIETHRHHRLTGDEPGLVACFPFDDADGPRVRDTGPSGLHGAISGAAWEMAEVPFAPAAPVQSTGLEDYAYWQRWSQTLPKPQPGQVKPFRRGLVWR